MSEKKSWEQAVEDLTLTLLYLTRFSDRDGARFNELAWKNFDSDTIRRLDESDFIIAPHRSRGRCGYAYLTEKGRERARALLDAYAYADTPLYERYVFRMIHEDEAEEAAKVEEICFPPNEACSRSMMIERIHTAPDYFLVAIDRENDRIAGFLNGLATNEARFRDAFFTDASLHDPAGRTIMILGLDVLPAYRKQGLARELVYSYCRRMQAAGIRRLVLTCLDNKVKMYQRMGFRDLGEANSSWGGEKWHEMECILNYADNEY